VTTTTRPATTPWEQSKAYYDWVHESKDMAQRMLTTWGSRTNTQWPDDARFISINELTSVVVIANAMGDYAPRSIVKRIPGWKLAELFPQKRWDAYTHDVYFFEVKNGNVEKAPRKPTHQLGALTIGSDAVRYILLGCDHPNRTTVRQANCYREYQCLNCEYTWGEDSSG
jgi:hypothetical protein